MLEAGKYAEKPGTGNEKGRDVSGFSPGAKNESAKHYLLILSVQQGEDSQLTGRTQPESSQRAATSSQKASGKQPESSRKLNQSALSQRRVPLFFQVPKIIGLSLAAVSSSIATVTIALPLIVIEVARYVAVDGPVATAVSQVTVDSEN